MTYKTSLNPPIHSVILRVHGRVRVGFICSGSSIAHNMTFFLPQDCHGERISRRSTNLHSNVNLEKLTDHFSSSSDGKVSSTYPQMIPFVISHSTFVKVGFMPDNVKF